MKRTLFVGLDAACWEYLDPLLLAGRLPTVARLMNNGSWGTLDSTLPAQTPTAWSSIITGKNPGKHGVFDFLMRVPGSHTFNPISARTRQGMPFWKRLNESGIRVGLVNAPFTYPIEPLDGFMVCGFGTPDSVRDLVFPEHELGWIEERHGVLTPVVPTRILRTGTPVEIFEAELRQQTRFVEVALELAGRYQVEILVINLLLPDHANHKMPRMADVERAICESDADLSRLLEAFEPDNVMLFSDHGSRRVKGDFLLHAWLRDQGYCVQIPRQPGERAEALNFVLQRWLREQGHTGLREKVLRAASRSALLGLPNGSASRYWRQLDEKYPFAHEHVFLSDEIDPTRSQVFLGSAYAGLLHFNHRQRSSGEHSVLFEEIAEKLVKLSDPDTGQPLFSACYSPEAIYQGPASQSAPDVILDIYDSPWNILATFRRGYIGETVRNRYFGENFRDFGHHSRKGIFIFSGSDFKAGLSGIEGHILDLPATLLHLYDVAIPEDYDGTVLTDVICDAFMDHHPVQSQVGEVGAYQLLGESYTEEENQVLVEHLRALGYLD
jgi:predicted AlkP superfamily phosphohydrolase/phosphomutase